MIDIFKYRIQLTNIVVYKNANRKILMESQYLFISRKTTEVIIVVFGGKDTY